MDSRHANNSNYDSPFEHDLLATTGSVFDDQDEALYQRPVHNIGCLTSWLPLDTCDCFIIGDQRPPLQQPFAYQQQAPHHPEPPTAPSWADIAASTSTHGSSLSHINHNIRQDVHSAELFMRRGQGAVSEPASSASQRPTYHMQSSATSRPLAQYQSQRPQPVRIDQRNMTNRAMMRTATPMQYQQQPTYAQIAGRPPMRARHQGQVFSNSVQLLTTHEDLFDTDAISPWPTSGHVTDFRPQAYSQSSPIPILPDFPSNTYITAGNTTNPRSVDRLVVGTSRGGHRQGRRLRADSASGASPSAPSRSPSVASLNRRPRRTGMDLFNGVHGCSQCPARFSDRGDLRRHESRVHSDPGRRPYPCIVPDCGRSFHDPKDFIRHTQVHNPGARLICPYCGSTFVGNRMDNFNRHIRVQHTPQSVTGTTDSGGAGMSRQASQMSSGSYNPGFDSQQATPPSSFGQNWQC